MIISEIDIRWLTIALSSGGYSNEEILDFAVARIGTGQMAETYRVTPRYATRTDGPASVIVKLSPADETSRATAKAQASYAREVNYYRHLAPTVEGRTPACLHSEIDDDGVEFALVLEDVGPARVGDQIAGCSVAECYAAIDQIALIHGPRWGDSSLAAMPWLNIGDSFYSMAIAWQQANWETFKERYGDLLDSGAVAIGERLVAHIEALFAKLARMPLTIQHGDFRADNVMFDIHDGAEPVAIVDWQTVMLGPGVLDVAYFVGATLPAGERRSHEMGLFDRYYDSLADQGVRYAKASLWDDYRVSACWLYLVAMGASVNVARTDRGDQMFMSMIDRATGQMADLESLKAISE